jgi:hypothetical protein
LCAGKKRRDGIAPVFDANAAMPLADQAVWEMTLLR